MFFATDTMGGVWEDMVAAWQIPGGAPNTDYYNVGGTPSSGNAWNPDYLNAWTGGQGTPVGGVSIPTGTPGTPNPKPRNEEKGLIDKFTEWAGKKENQTMVLFGGVALVLILTSGKKK